MYSVARKEFIFHRLEASEDDGRMPAQSEDLLKHHDVTGDVAEVGCVCLVLSYLLIFNLCVWSFACIYVCAARLCLVPLGN